MSSSPILPDNLSWSEAIWAAARSGRLWEIGFDASYDQCNKQAKLTSLTKILAEHPQINMGGDRPGQIVIEHGAKHGRRGI
ncbi:hypothetical protein BN1723_011965 [Verticillium longisporum]|uniref:Uncharacterized protein n=1 Tax=Verticillium longisporum TaxID=100787 RepID=A0A0G4LCD1_VERLO|nr:hypothetical protein BN1723_011965 [Verticillium longisporum]